MEPVHFTLHKPMPIKAGHLHMGPAGAEVSPSGDRLEVNSRFFTLNGVPHLWRMGEFQFSRYDGRLWEPELRKMKAAGINVIASYVFWIHHEEEKGVFRFDGDRDMRRFVELCAKCGLYVWLRIGPWCHGEARNGGFPDWVLAEDPRELHVPDWGARKCMAMREDKQPFIGYVDRLYGEYGKQLAGLMWKDGGPIIGVQLDNECPDNADFLGALKKLAIKNGFAVPFYSVTAWGNKGVAAFPAFEVLPFFGGYCEAPWAGHTDPPDPSPLFSTIPYRNETDIGADLLADLGVEQDESVLLDYPYATCETGPGTQITHQRRPIHEPKDVYANAMLQVAKGNSLIGYYVFHGGRNPIGPGFYQESFETGYINELPVISYDFQAPLDEFGMPRLSYDYFRLAHAFFASAETLLPRAVTYYPDKPMDDPADLLTPRTLLRLADERTGFLFVNTHMRIYTLPALHDFSVSYTTSDGVAHRLPAEPIDVPADVTAAFPVGLPLGDTVIGFASVQPITTIEQNGRRAAFFAAIDGMEARFELASTASVLCRASASVDTAVRVRPSRSPAFSVGDTDVYVLPFGDALRFYAFGDRAFITDLPLYEEDGKIVVYGRATGTVREWNGRDGFTVLPDTDVAEPTVTATLTETEPTVLRSDLPALRYLQAKREDCREYRLDVSANALTDADDVCLVLDLRGDSCQIYGGDKLIYDNYSAGIPLHLHVSRLADTMRAGDGIRVIVAPLGDRDIYVQRRVPRKENAMRVSAVYPIFRRTLG